MRVCGINVVFIFDKDRLVVVGMVLVVIIWFNDMWWSL